MTLKKKIFIFVCLIGLVGCGDSKEDYQQSLAEQEQISSQQQIEAARIEQERKAGEMEKYLNKRKVFIQAIEGEFSGDLSIESSEFRISLEIIPSLPIEFHDRVRQLEEIAFEIENLSLNLKIKMENPKVPNSATSCNIVNYKPNLEKGIINVITNECKNVFKFILSDTQNQLNLQQVYGDAIQVSRSVISGDIEIVEFFDGIFEPSISSTKHQFKLARLR